MKEHVYLMAPEVREDTGVVTRLRRYEQALTTRGCTVQTLTFRQAHWPHKVDGHTHILDPVELVQTALRMAAQPEGAGADDHWWPAVLSPYSVTVARPLDRAGAHVARLAEQLIHGAQAILVGCEATARTLVERHGVEVGNIVIAPTPLEAVMRSTYSSDIDKRIARAVGPHRQVLLCVAAVAPGRGILRFLRLVEATRYVHPHVIGILVGPVADESFARQVLPLFARAGVVYVGAVDHCHMAQFYARASLLIDTAEDAALSAAVGEALAQKLPVIVHRSAWDEGVRPGNLELWDAEAHALRLIDQRLRSHVHKDADSENVMDLPTIAAARADWEGQYLYACCNPSCIDGEISVG